MTKQQMIDRYGEVYYKDYLERIKNRYKSDPYYNEHHKKVSNVSTKARYAADTMNNEIDKPLKEYLDEIKQTLKKMQEDIDLLMKQRVREDVYFNTFMQQYDAPPLPMTQACSYEDQMKSIENYNKYWETK